MKSDITSKLNQEVTKKQKIEIKKLKELLIKQQGLLNKMNDENMQLSKKINHFEKSSLTYDHAGISIKE